MPRTEVIAKKDFLPFFKKGDKASIVPVLYEQDTMIVNELFGVFRDGVMYKIAELRDFTIPNMVIKKISDPVYALKDSYKDSYIELADGRQYPSSLIRDYNDFFKKIKE